MTISELLLPEFDQEIETTRRVLERVPDDRGDWKPHPKAFPMGHLAQLVARLPGWTMTMMSQTEFDRRGEVTIGACSSEHWRSVECASTFTYDPSSQRVMTMHANGPFDVKLAPVAPAHGGEGALGRMSIDKQFHGDLDARSEGEMLSVMNATTGSGGYVALERVTGSLHGRAGSFVLQHSATMNRGAPQLAISVVPDSGTGQLAGLKGSMGIIIESRKHSYEFDYTLGDAV